MKYCRSMKDYLKIAPANIEMICRSMLLLSFGFLLSVDADVYIVMMKGDPVVNYRSGVARFAATASDSYESMKIASEKAATYSLQLEKQHDTLLDALFERGTYKKLYSYKHLINGFAVDISPKQAQALKWDPRINLLEKDMKMKKLTTHTPKFLGLPTTVWPTDGGYNMAGEDIVIGFVDSGINPNHPSFSTSHSKPYGILPKYKGKCQFSYCNGKIIGAQHFAAAAIASGQFNPALDLASPFDGSGHGSHIAAIAAGNNGIPVKLYGHEFGKASGMAPRARIAVYKALYSFAGGFVADVVAAIEQAVKDGVDILNLSVGPNSPANVRTTFLNPFDATLLSAVKAGVFVAQAAGNGGPFSKTMVSFSPWIASVAAAVDDRRYENYLTLGSGKILPGIGLAPASHGNGSFNLVAAIDVTLDTSVMKYSPSDCQTPNVLNKNMVKGKILICGYSFNFIVGSASVKKVSETAKSLEAAGFILAVEDAPSGTRFDPVAVSIPGIVITDASKTKELVTYYRSLTKRDPAGRVTNLGATGRIGDGLRPVLSNSAPQVALFSSRGPDVRDFTMQDADVLKPDILAPGVLIWAAWSPNGTEDANYKEEQFAMASGTSMAAPHIAGIAALIKQKHPNWSPAAIKSALMTTASTLDEAGRPLLAQQYSKSETIRIVEATPFDYGSGEVNPHAALDPGLIFDAGYDDYMLFLCSTPGVDHKLVLNYTNHACSGRSQYRPADLNTPYITISRLHGTQTFRRTVKNVARMEETYSITSKMSPAVAMEVKPLSMTLRPGASRNIYVTLTVRSITGEYSFGEILMRGSRKHVVKIPVVAQGFGRRQH